MHRYSGSDKNLEIRLNKINTICSKIMLFYSPIICNMPLPHDSLTAYCFLKSFHVTLHGIWIPNVVILELKNMLMSLSNDHRQDKFE